jgi:glucose 1-dehydrogenase
MDSRKRVHVLYNYSYEPIHTKMQIPFYQRLKNQTAIITGASSGIGKAIALQMALEGANVVVNYYVHEDPANELVEEIREKGSDAIAIQADVGDEEQVRAMFRQSREKFGNLHILVSNAGIQKDSPVEEMTFKQWQKVLATNLSGAFLCAREAILMFQQQGKDESISPAKGKIIFISSVHELIPWAERVNYAASKGGLMMLMKSLAQEVSSEKIRINSIAPGAIRTPINEDAWSDEESLNKLLELIPYHRVGEPEDVARAAVWLASDESDYVVGTTLFIDGGMALYPGFIGNG